MLRSLGLSAGAAGISHRSPFNPNKNDFAHWQVAAEHGSAIYAEGNDAVDGTCMQDDLRGSHGERFLRQPQTTRRA